MLQDASMLTVQPFDQTMVNEIEKAIRASDLGLNPSNDGPLDPDSDPTSDRGAAPAVREVV
jgi:hypothetical protein